MLKQRLVVVGGSYAALNAAAAARDAGFDGTVTMVSQEAVPPYQRPPLSKALLKDQIGVEDLPLKGESFYRDQAIDLLLDRTATALDPVDRQLSLSDGSRLPYDRLVLACGARPRRLEGAADADILYLRDLNDALALRSRLAQAGSLLVLGGGYIGLEVASAAAAMGLQVMLVAGRRRILARCAPAVISDRLEARHRAAGVEIVAGVAVSAEGTRVTLADGRIFGADLIVAGLGAIPNSELASSAGLATGDGIEVDEFGQTSASDIYAVGDCASHVNLWAGERTRLESVQNAVDQARAAGATIAGKRTPYRAAPRFWSDQYDLKLQMVGLSAGAQHHELIATTPTGCSFMHVRDERIIGVTSINDVRTQMWARRSLADRPLPLAEASLPSPPPQAGAGAA